MARTEITITNIDVEGAEIDFVASNEVDGNYFVNNGRTYLIAKNASANPAIVTVKCVQCSHGLTQDIEITVPDGEQYVAGPFPKTLFNQVGTVDHAYVEVSEDTDLTLAAIKL